MRVSGFKEFDNVDDMHPAPLLHRNVQWFRGGLVRKAHRLLYYSTLGLRVVNTNTCTQHHSTMPSVGGGRGGTVSSVVQGLRLEVWGQGFGV